MVRSGRRCLWSAHRSHCYSKTETSPPSVQLRAVAESTGQYVFHVRTYCPETPSASLEEIISRPLVLREGLYGYDGHAYAAHGRGFDESYYVDSKIKILLVSKRARNDPKRKVISRSRDSSGRTNPLASSSKWQEFQEPRAGQALTLISKVRFLQSESQASGIFGLYMAVKANDSSPTQCALMLAIHDPPPWCFSRIELRRAFRPLAAFVVCC